MTATLTIRDQSPAGATLHELSLDFLTERVTVRELIRSRVYQEVKDHNVRTVQTSRSVQTFRGLVQPEDAERALNGPKAQQPRQIDWKRQFDVALDAFQRKGFLILVDDRQVQSLDDEIEIKPRTEVSFVTPAFFAAWSGAAAYLGWKPPLGPSPRSRSVHIENYPASVRASSVSATPASGHSATCPAWTASTSSPS